MNQPAAIINLEVYEDSVNLLGVAKVTLPSITYPTVRFIASLARTPQSLAGKIGALCFVLAAAAIAIGQYGANGAIKNKRQVEEYLASHR